MLNGIAPKIKWCYNKGLARANLLSMNQKIKILIKHFNAQLWSKV